MAREILFKAKRTDNGEWVEGYYFCMVHDDGRHVHHFIMPLGSDLSLGTSIEKIQVEIDINTICQYTGLTDKNGNKIWENDVVKQTFEKTYEIDYGFGNGYEVEHIYGDEKGIVTITASKGVCIKRPYQNVWINEEQTKSNERLSTNKNVCQYRCEVIGNIFDNPELLGGADNG